MSLEKSFDQADTGYLAQDALAQYAQAKEQSDIAVLVDDYTLDELKGMRQVLEAELAVYASSVKANELMVVRKAIGIKSQLERDRLHDEEGRQQAIRTFRDNIRLLEQPSNNSAEGIHAQEPFQVAADIADIVFVDGEGVDVSGVSQSERRAWVQYQEAQGRSVELGGMKDSVDSRYSDSKVALTGEDFSLLQAALADEELTTEGVLAYEAKFNAERAADERARQEELRKIEVVASTPPLLQVPPQLAVPPLPSLAPQSNEQSRTEDTAAGRLLEGVGTPKSHRNGMSLKERLSFKKHPVVMLGSVGLTAVLAIGGGVYVGTSHDGSENSADANVNPSQINKDILKNINPDMTAANLKLAQCWDAPLLSGNVSGEAQVAMLYTVNDVVSGLRLQDTDPKTKEPVGAPHYLPISIDKTPVNVAVCAPGKLQAAIATMKDGVVTVNRADLTPNLNVAAAVDVKNVTIPQQKFDAAPAIGLTAEMAAAVTKSLTVAQNQADIATLSQVDLATTITKDTTSASRLSASLDARMQLLVQNQIEAFYKQQGRKAPSYKVAFAGSYPAPVAVSPTSLPDVIKRTDKMVKIVPGRTVIETLILNDGTAAGKK